jgi:exodeoxyribonuclease VII large subunit
LSIRRQLDQSQNRLVRSLRHLLATRQQHLHLLSQRLETMAHPLDRLLLRLDYTTTRLHQALQSSLERQQQRLAAASVRLAGHAPRHRLSLAWQRLQAAENRLHQGIQTTIHGCEKRFRLTAGVLHAVSPLATLARGYAIVRTRDKKGQLVRRATQVRPGDGIRVTLHRGKLDCRVEQVRGEEEQQE